MIKKLKRQKKHRKGQESFIRETKSFPQTSFKEEAAKGLFQRISCDLTVQLQTVTTTCVLFSSTRKIIFSYPWNLSEECWYFVIIIKVSLSAWGVGLEFRAWLLLLLCHNGQADTSRSSPLYFCSFAVHALRFLFLINALTSFLWESNLSLVFSLL